MSRVQGSVPSAREVLVLVASLRACAKTRDLCTGIRLHDVILKRGLLKQCCNALISMYARCGNLPRAKELLQLHRNSDAFTWTALISGFTHTGQAQDALDCFDHMHGKGISPDAATFVCVLQACGSIKAIDRGKEIHGEIARQGLLKINIVLGNALVDMYAKCGALSKAHSVLKALHTRNIISWNILIGGYAQHGQGEQALDCFEQMQREGLLPDPVTFVCILRVCGSTGAIDNGEEIRNKIAKRGLLRNSFVLGTALVDMYAKCGALSKAQMVLEELPVRDVVCWSALIAGYAEQGQGIDALKCYERMVCEGFTPSTVTYMCILKACGSIGAIEKIEHIHDKILREGLLKHDVILGNALVDMYVKCGSLVKAEQVLQELPLRNAVSWNALISGYAEQGDGKKALNCYEQMLHEGLSPSAVTFLCVLKACGRIGAVDKGEEIHDEIARQGLLGNDVALRNAIVDMYAKCGALAKAKQLLDELHVQDVISWNALISGYSRQGQSERVLQCFEEMEYKGLCPNAVSFLHIVKACASIGAADKAEQVHDAIARQELLKYDVVLVTALVDMYAKCGALSKARQVSEDLCVCNAASWSAILGACQKWGDADTGRWAFEHALHTDERNVAAHTDMAKLYTAACRQEKLDIVQVMRNQNGKSQGVIGGWCE